MINIRRFFVSSILIFSAVLSITGCRVSADTEREIFILLTEDRGLLISNNNGKQWNDYNRGLPPGIIPLNLRSDSRKGFFLITLNSGIYRFKAAGDTWESINSPMFLSPASIKPGNEYRKITAFAVNGDNPDHLALATKHSMYLSKNGGASWNEVPIKGNDKINYITSIALSGSRPDIYAGTSFNGIFKVIDGKFTNFSRGLPIEKYSAGTYFHEEVTEIAAGPEGSGLYAGLAFGRGLFSFKGDAWTDMRLPLPPDKESFIHRITPGKNEILISTDYGACIYDTAKKTWSMEPNSNPAPLLPGKSLPLSLFIIPKSGDRPMIHHYLSDYRKKISPPSINNLPERKAIYASAYQANAKISQLIQVIRETGLNSIVIDMKDDSGNLFFPTENKTAVEIGATRARIQTPAILKELKDKGIYSIARVVVFKDRNLFRAYGGKYAIWNSGTNSPWQGNPNEHWVDPYSSFVRNYNVQIALELEKIGFDEIQFDYIRFPSDGATYLCHYRYMEGKDIYKSEAIAQLLMEVKKEVKANISVDIYGFSAWYKSGNWIGQDIESLSSIVDVICPMNYPSHFGNQFLMEGPYELHPYRIMFFGGKRANRHANGRARIRPYLQAFNLLSPTWGPGYILNQVRGAEESDCSGYIFWNARTDYSMVTSALAGHKNKK